MRRSLLVAALALVPAALSAQQGPYYGMAPTPPPKPVSFQAWGGMTIPLMYNYYSAVNVDDIGWTAGGSLIYRPNSRMHARVEGEYHYVGTSSGSGAALYGGGIGGGRAITQGNAATEGYFMAGLYNVEVCATLTGSSCTSEASDLQFGTKLGANFVAGRGKVRPMLGFGWLYTWSYPYVSAITITGGLRF